jgi:serine/threonine protein kinase
VIDDRFQVGRLLGAGAMGAVYLAHDRELDEEVALKVLPPLDTSDETAVRRFLNEIRVARRISHRNVVRTHDVGRWSGGLFLTMEYVPGHTLRELLDARGALPANEVATLGAQVADALVVAHEQGVIHRDIKPQNLLLDAKGQVKVLDFGIAVIQGTSGQLTEAGLVVGTPAYMAPEQLLGEPVTPASDLYALGVVLYEAISGALPFTAATPMALVAQMVNRAPAPLADVAPGCDPRLERLVMRLLARDATERPHSALEARDELRGPPTTRRPSRPGLA